MIYENSKDWLAARDKKVLLFGMSGLGKTHLSRMLRSKDWFHYSVDYRIGTRYMGEFIVDNFKREAMKVPFLANLLHSDSIYVASNITFENLDVLSTYLGKPGDPAKGGLSIEEYRVRQNQHHKAEVAALLDTGSFIERAKDVYNYDRFVCDTGGSICEVVDPFDPGDPVLTYLSERTLMVWLKGNDSHAEELIRRFSQQPKPMCYSEAFLNEAWQSHLEHTGCAPESVDPDAFLRWAYARAISHRAPIYEKMSDWGVTVDAADIANIKDEADFDAMIGEAIDRRNTQIQG